MRFRVWLYLHEGRLGVVDGAGQDGALERVQVVELSVIDLV